MTFDVEGNFGWNNEYSFSAAITESGLVERKADLIFGVLDMYTKDIEPISPDMLWWESYYIEGVCNEYIKIEATETSVKYDGIDFPVYSVTLFPLSEKSYFTYSDIYMVSVHNTAGNGYDDSIESCPLNISCVPATLLSEDVYEGFINELDAGSGDILSDDAVEKLMYGVMAEYSCGNTVGISGCSGDAPSKYYLVVNDYAFFDSNMCDFNNEPSGFYANLDLKHSQQDDTPEVFVDSRDGKGKGEKHSSGDDSRFTIEEIRTLKDSDEEAVAKVYEITFYPGQNPYTLALPLNATFRDNNAPHEIITTIQLPVDMRINVVNDYTINTFFKYKYDKNLKKNVISELYSFNGEEGKLTDEEIFNINLEMMGGIITSQPVFVTETDLDNYLVKAKFIVASKNSEGAYVSHEFNEERVEFNLNDFPDFDNNKYTQYIPFSNEIININTTVKKTETVKYKNKAFDVYEVEFDGSNATMPSGLFDFINLSAVSIDGLIKNVMFIPYQIAVMDEDIVFAPSAEDLYKLSCMHLSTNITYTLDWKESANTAIFAPTGEMIYYLMDDETGEPIFYIETDDGLITDQNKVKEYVTYEKLTELSVGDYYRITFVGMQEDYTIIIPSTIDNSIIGKGSGLSVVPYDTRIRVNTKYKVTTQKVDEVKPACETAGVKAYYKGSDGKYYLDADAKNEIKDIEAWKKGEGAIKALGHNWQNATLKKAKTCTRCGKTEGWKLEKVKSITYNILSKSPRKVEIVDVSKKLTKVTIGKTVTISKKKYSVVGIAANAFKGKTKLTEVKVGDYVTSIGDYAFSGCSKLKNVTLGKKVKKIGAGAFSKCKALTTVTIPSKVTSIGTNAFASDSKLKTVTIKTSSLKTVGKNAFKGISKKAKIYVPKKKYSAYVKLLTKAGVSKKMIAKK